MQASADPVLVREWDNDLFHRRVLEYEAKGYVARRETYTVMADMNPETGEVVHLYIIEMVMPEGMELPQAA
jgi:hypothetical protein